MALSLGSVSSSLGIGGVGSALFVRSGGLTFLCVVAPAARVELVVSSFPSRLRRAGFNGDMDSWFSDNLRGLLFMGMLDMRKGMMGGPAGEELPEVRNVGRWG